MQTKHTEKGSAPFVFRHFAGKGWSLFAAMGREVKIGVLSAATLTVAAAAHASSAHSPSLAEDGAAKADSISGDDATALALGEAVALAQHAPMPAAMAARRVMAFSRADIAAAGAQTVGDIVKLSAAVDVRQRGPHGMQADISVGGGTFDQVTIMLNGINITSPHTGHLSADFPLSALDIERIEILEGAAARSAGPTAFTGVVNIVTRREHGGANVAAAGGMYGYADAGLRISASARKATGHLSGGYTRSDGATQNSAFQAARAFWQGTMVTRSGATIDAQLGYSYKPYEANTFYGSASTDQWECNERWMGAMRLNAVAGRLHITPTLSWNRWYDHYQWHKGSPAGENFHRVDTYALGIDNWIAWKGGRTAFGVEARHEGILSTKLGEPLEESAWEEVGGLSRHTRGSANAAESAAKTTESAAESTKSAAESGQSTTQYYKYAAGRTNLSAHLEHNIIAGQWSISAGVLANMNTALDTHWRFYPGVDMAWHGNGGWAVYASWNMALRMPTFTDLYYSGTGIEGTRDLNPERTNDASLKAAYTRGAWAVEAGAFYSHKSDMIDWVVYTDEHTRPDGTVADPAEWTFRSGNYTMDHYGVRANVAWHPQQAWGAAFPLRKVALQYAWTGEDIHRSRDILASKYAMEYVRQKWVVSADGTLWRHQCHSQGRSADWRSGRLALAVAYRWVDRTGSGNASYGILDARLSWEGSRLTLFADADNVLDTQYADFSYIPQPGIWITGGINLKF